MTYNTFNESYNYLPYLLAASLDNKRHQRILVLYKGGTLAKILRVILFQKDVYYLNRHNPNKGIFESKSQRDDLVKEQVAQRATIAHLSPMCQHPLISNKPASKVIKNLNSLQIREQLFFLALVPPMSAVWTCQKSNLL